MKKGQKLFIDCLFEDVTSDWRLSKLRRIFFRHFLTFFSVLFIQVFLFFIFKLKTSFLFYCTFSTWLFFEISLNKKYIQLTGHTINKQRWSSVYQFFFKEIFYSTLARRSDDEIKQIKHEAKYLSKKSLNFTFLLLLVYISPLLLIAFYINKDLLLNFIAISTISLAYHLPYLGAFKGSKVTSFLNYYFLHKHIDDYLRTARSNDCRKLFDGRNREILP